MSVYKLFEVSSRSVLAIPLAVPHSHTPFHDNKLILNVDQQRPIIVDEELQSPGAVTLAYEEEAARANGGGLSLSMSTTYKSQPPQVHGFADSPYSQFSPQSFASHTTDHATPQQQQQQQQQHQLNNLAFAANSAASAAARYGPTSPAESGASVEVVGGDLNVLSCQPAGGPPGTRVTLRVSSQADLAACGPYVFMSFGSQKCPAEVCKETESSSGWVVYSVAATAPPQHTQSLLLGVVPLGLVVDTTTSSSAEGGMARVVSGGSFTYHHPEGGSHGPLAGSVGAAGDLGHAHEDSSLKGDDQVHVGSQGGSPSPQHPQHQQHHNYHHQQQQPPHLTVKTSGISSPIHQRHQHQQLHDQQQQHHDQQQTHESQHHHQNHHHLHHAALSADPTTSTYDYAPLAGVLPAPDAQQVLPQVHHHMPNDVSAAAYGQQGSTADMLGSYRTTTTAANARPSYLDPYRPASSLRSSGGWSSSTYGGQDLASSTTDRYESALARPALITPSPRMSHGGGGHRASSGLVRTSILNAAQGQHGGYPGSSGGHWASAAPKAQLHIRGSLDSMTAGWTHEEWTNQRRIVVFTKQHSGCSLDVRFRAVPVAECQPGRSIAISCIWWAGGGPDRRGDFYATSVDILSLLERLIEPLAATMGKFGVEERNRIRRNLEGLKPITVSKGKPETEDFFKLIMGFPNPKPRNIEKDVKVFSWKVLGPALKKIVGKYSYDPSGAALAANPSIPPQHQHQHHSTSILGSSHHLGLPAASSYLPTPVSTTTATDPALASGYVTMATSATHHLDTTGLPSPRSSSAWSASTAAYAPPPSTTRTISPGSIKVHSPPGLKLSTLPGVYDSSSRTAGPLSAPAYGMHHHSGMASPHHHQHHSATTASSRWDPYDVPVSSSYSVPVSSYPSLTGLHQHSRYGTASGYGGDQR